MVLPMSDPLTSFSSGAAYGQGQDNLSKDGDEGQADATKSAMKATAAPFHYNQPHGESSTNGSSLKGGSRSTKESATARQVFASFDEDDELEEGEIREFDTPGGRITNPFAGEDEEEEGKALGSFAVGKEPHRPNESGQDEDEEEEFHYEPSLDVPRPISTTSSFPSTGLGHRTSEPMPITSFSRTAQKSSSIPAPSSKEALSASASTFGSKGDYLARNHELSQNEEDAVNESYSSLGLSVTPTAAYPSPFSNKGFANASKDGVGKEDVDELASSTDRKLNINEADADASASETPRVSQEPSNTQNGPRPHPADPLNPSIRARDLPQLMTIIMDNAIAGNLTNLQTLFHPADLGFEVPFEPYPSAFALANMPLKAGMTALHFAASRGKLDVVRWLVEEEGAMTELEDEQGETCLGKASYRGHLQIIRYLLSNASNYTPFSPTTVSASGSISSLSEFGRTGATYGGNIGEDEDDREPPRADVEQKDADGWTALHNAASKGYYDIVRFLVERAGAKVDVQSKMGYTPLMNAASKGHLPIVRFLTAKHGADPFIRNNFGETAYDVAAASFEINICDVLATYEAKVWDRRQSLRAASSPGSDVPHQPYNPLALHSTVPIIIYENQRLDLRLTTLAKSFSISAVAGSGAGTNKPQFTSAALSKNDRRTPFGMPGCWDGINASGEELPVFRSDVGLPTVEDPFQLVLPTFSRQGSQHSGGSSSSRPTLSRARSSSVSNSSRASSSTTVPQGQSGQSRLSVVPSTVPPSAERSHFWLCDWQVDLTPSNVDAIEGWQYSTSFHEPMERWSAEKPVELERILGENTSNSGGAGSDLSGTEAASKTTKWVRRRRWIRVLRRRLDRSPLPFADVDESENDGAAERTSDEADYLAKAQYLVGNHRLIGGAGGGREFDTISVKSGKTAVNGLREDEGQELTKAELRKKIARLERAVEELINGSQNDQDPDRQQQALQLLGVISNRLGDLKADEASRDDDDDEDFVYPGAEAEVEAETEAESSMSRSPTSAILSGTSGHASSSILDTAFSSVRQRVPDLTPQLSQATNFRVPTHEAPAPQLRRGSSARAVQIRVGGERPSWERDEDAHECRRCGKKFGLWVRKHHCRRCGRIFCATCSQRSVHLPPSEAVLDPALANDPWGALSTTPGSLHRVCDGCYDIVNSSGGGNNEEGGQSRMRGESDLLNPLSAAVSGASGWTPGSPLRGSDFGGSEVSDLSECPVCGTNLTSLGPKADQEAHVKNCLEGGGGQVAQNGRYLVFKLPQGSPLIGTECVICFEEFTVGSSLGRLSCFCFFHASCISAWLQRGKACPIHARLM